MMQNQKKETKLLATFALVLLLLPLANATRLLNIQQIQNSGNIFIEAAVVGI